MSRKIYLDYCATTPVHPEVKNAMMTALEAGFGNPSSMHWAGMDAAAMVKQAHQEIAFHLGCQPEEICFTSGATEADNLALLGTLRKYAPDKAHLIVSAIEHHAILHAAQRLE
ncbi:MAG: aminotransferase class V-fold PLP-dependent enzyme, partial [Chloroflexi bacterium]|nr:aminotransferase class V-fold PLP-dependent enzyme [Chloroflexota bacterium]